MKPAYKHDDFSLTIVDTRLRPEVQWACVLGSRDPLQKRWKRFERDWLRALSMTEWPDTEHAKACIRAFARAEKERK